ncbi:MAG: PhzF family phenazine biosynthesis isomerase [Chloroflexi bacterium]|nr:PhzF family phenazine biosynthesis isomerase [Chloroflexota bacterium]
MEPVPIALNESDYTTTDVLNIIRAEAAEVILPDPHEAGGLWQACKATATGEGAGIPVTLHSGGELGFSTAAYLHLAASTPNMFLAIDGQQHNQTDDIVPDSEVFRYDHGHFTVPTGPGLGMSLDNAKLARIATDTIREAYPDVPRPEWFAKKTRLLGRAPAISRARGQTGDGTCAQSESQLNEGHTMRRRMFCQVDVFTDVPYLGNPLAVVLDGTDLSTEEMQQFTSWTNLSEATFVLPALHQKADYRVRIFTGSGELPFAGHPTLGSCHAWLEAGGMPQGSEVVQECGVGLVRISRSGRRLAFAAPPRRRSGALDEAELNIICRALGINRDNIINHSWCDNGPQWRAIMLRSAEEVLALRPDAKILGDIKLGIVGPHSGGGCAFEVRAIYGTEEDPVTGSLNAAIAQWLIGQGLAPDEYVASQGTVLGRAGRVHIRRDAMGEIWVGGDTVTCIEGTVIV